MRLERPDWRCLVAAAVILGCSAGGALAGPWPQPEGQGFVITTVSVLDAENRANRPNPAFGQGSYREYVLGSYAEYGLTKRLTIGAQPQFDIAELKTDHGTRTTSGFGDLELFARTVVWQQSEWWGAAQANIKVPTGYETNANPAIGNGQIDFEPRVSIGRGFDLSGWTGFGYLDAGYRFRFGIPNDEVRINLVAGLRPRERWTIYIESFNIISTVQPPRGINFSLSTLVGALVYDISAHWSVQLGIFSQVAATNFNRGAGASTGVWWRF